MLTDLQKYRVSFHLGYPSQNITVGYLLAIYGLNFTGINEQGLLMLVGQPLEDPPQLDRYTLLGQDLCQQGSILHRVELAYEKIGSDVIEESLLAKQAGDVILRSDETRARWELYEKLVNQLEVVTGVPRFHRSLRIGG